MQSIIQVPGEKFKAWRGRSMTKAADELKFGTFGVHKAGLNRFYWAVLPYDENYNIVRTDGFVVTKEAAIAKALATIADKYPEGYCFAMKMQDAAHAYQQHYAKETKFEEHPSGSMWLHDSGSWDGSDWDYWKSYPIIRETERFYYISSEHIAGTEVSVKRNARDGYYRISKAQLEKDGYFFNRDISYSGSLYKDPPPKFFEEFECDGKGYWHKKIPPPHIVLRDPNAFAYMETVEDVDKEIKLCRKIAQKNHPDKNKVFDIVLYHKAIKRLDGLRQIRRSFKKQADEKRKSN